MKVLRFIALYILIIVAFPAFAQLGIPAGWKIDAAVEAASNQDIDITANDIDMTKGSMRRKMKAMINASRTFVIDRHLSMGLNYDLKLSKECSLTAQAGWEYTMRARMFHRNGHHERLDFGHPNGLYARMAVNCRIR